MTVLTKAQYRLTTIAAGLGIVQGTAWFVMSLICIILYLDTSSAPSYPTGTYNMDYFNYYAYHTFLNRNSLAENIITPDAFTIFMWIYLLSDFLWVVLSVLQLYFINKVNGNPLNIMKCWGVVACFISFIDFLLVVLIGADYDDCTDIDSAICTQVLIPVLTIAAKGFILWIINVIFIYLTYRIIRTIQSGKNLRRKLISTDAQIPRATLQGTPSIYSRSQSNSSFTNSSTPFNFNSNPRTSGYQSKSPPTSPYYAAPQQQPSLAKY